MAAVDAVWIDLVGGRELGTIEGRIPEVAREWNGLPSARKCVCGAHYSIAALARCPRCDAPIADSWFHSVEHPGG